MEWDKDFINKVIQGDCLEVLKTMPDNSVDAVVTDPPYGLSFMGKKWDYDVPSIEVWNGCLRVLKPGGYLLSFAGTRTQHRMAVRIEDAGFEIRDMIAWVYGSGFPKSLNIGKAVDKITPRLGQFDAFSKHFLEQIKASGKTQKEISALFPSKTGGLTGCVWNWANGANVPTLEQYKILQPLLELSEEFTPLIERTEKERELIGRGKAGLTAGTIANFSGEEEFDLTKGNSEWEGWGTALKPALEPITVARKPLSEKTVAENCLKWGVGGIQIDGCRVGTGEDKIQGGCKTKGDAWNKSLSFSQEHKDKIYSQGRFPANLIHDGSDEVVSLFPNESQRFFYSPKSSKSERNKGCEELPLGDAPASARSKPAEGRQNALGEPRHNNHPTVKPIALMEYIVKLVSREGAVVLDPFAGSGSTLIACKNLNRKYIGIEKKIDYCEIARKRLEYTETPLF